MISLIFPDGQKRDYPKGVTGLAIAEGISKTLLKKAVALRLNNDLYDLNRPIHDDGTIAIITKDTDEGLDVIRHDAAHVFAQAVKELFPKTQITIGPSIEHGFYYDILPEKLLTPDDLPMIEERMRQIVGRAQSINREEWDRNEAIQFFKDQGEFFKAEIIQDLPEHETISLYRQGDFIDLCRGPHMPTTAYLGTAFKLLTLAGAYWRGDSKNPMLQRVYGTAWANQADLEQYLFRIEEAKKRDHRKLGTELDLFHVQEEAVGAVFWHPKGWTFYRTLENFIRTKLEHAGYVEVKTPQLVDRTLWEASGHWEKFREHMFTVEADEGRTLAVKPMNCPCHVQIFNKSLKSYRDLPLRMAEFGSCHRNEPSGAMHGIMRVRAFTQDDAHIFCTPEQIVSETKAFCDLLKDVYRAFDFHDIRIKFSDRPETRAGADEIWDLAENSLKEAADAAGLECTLNPGEGAFYGPKIEFVLTDAIGRDWQCGTLQVDFVLPERLGAEYVGEDGKRHRPVMLHRAIFGSFERFIGVLIEHYAGKFPLWLAPTQAVVATITTTADAYAQKVTDALKKAGLRVDMDLRNEKINYKVREHSLKKVPVLLVVGQKEAEQETVAIRRLGSTDQTILSLEDAITSLTKEASIPA